MKRFPAISTCLFLLLSVTCLAKDIETVLPGGALAEADYRQGNPDKPAILLIHGFLTVHNFNLIQNIASELADNGFTVLAPTLTLGISKRRTTLDCDALHLHSMDEDLKEIEWWVKWLIDNGHKKIILMGHSSGAVQIVAYANTFKHREVTKLIALSLVPLSSPMIRHSPESNQQASNLVKKNNTEIHNFTVAYCIDNYSSPVKQYLSYAQWNSSRILKSLNALILEKTIIIGSMDTSRSDMWINDIKNTNSIVYIIEGADHFFGSGTEFELYDRIMQGIAGNQDNH